MSTTDSCCNECTGVGSPTSFPRRSTDEDYQGFASIARSRRHRRDWDSHRHQPCRCHPGSRDHAARHVGHRCGQRCDVRRSYARNRQFRRLAPQRPSDDLGGHLGRSGHRHHSHHRRDHPAQPDRPGQSRGSDAAFGRHGHDHIADHQEGLRSHRERSATGRRQSRREGRELPGQGARNAGNAGRAHRGRPPHPGRRAQRLSIRPAPPEVKAS